MPHPRRGKVAACGSAWQGPRPCRTPALIRASRPNAYTGSPLDRASHRRDDEPWVAAALADPDTLWAPVWRARNLVQLSGTPRAVFVDGDAAAALRAKDTPWALLGLLDGRPLFGLDASAIADPGPPLPPGLGEFADLRAAARVLPARQAAILAHARGLLHWRARNRFCASCGQATVPRHAGNATQCPSCATQHFPRTDPAVIMLVTSGDGERVLLGHSQRFPTSTMYSTLAGFVEPGESLEEAVAREVFEESGVRVADVVYHSSQPWPFPASIMLGFYARAVTEDIVIDPNELTDARWFTRAEVGDCAAHGFMLPGGDSIARRLIDDWAAHTEAAHGETAA